MIRAVLGVFLAAVAWGSVRGAADFGGLPAARALQAWWAARQFEAAALHEDLDGLERLGRALRQLGAGDAPLRFAAHRLGFQATGESWHLPEEEARLRARQGLELLDELLPGSADPWELRLIQVLILVNRKASDRDPRLARTAAEQWLASGGGPNHPFASPGAAYRAALRLPAEERSKFLLDRFRLGPLDGGGEE